MKPPRYAVTMLEPAPGCSVSGAVALNDSNQVLGYSRQTNAEVETACLWEGGIAHDLGRVSVSGINNKGQIVGCRFQGTLSLRAILCNNYRSKNLFQNDTATSAAKGINDAGQVVGYAQTRPTKWKTPSDIKRGAFLWERGKRRYLETPVGYRTIEATAINGQGTVVGTVRQQGTHDSHAVVWQEDGVKLLGEPKGFHSTQAEAVNDLGQILVSAKTLTVSPDNTCDIEQQSYLWHGGQWQAIEGLGMAHSLNNKSQMVGWLGRDSKTAPGANEYGDIHAALWEAGRIVDLNDSVAETSDWILQRAVGINNLGQIVGNGVFNGEFRAFLLTLVR